MGLVFIRWCFVNGLRVKGGSLPALAYCLCLREWIWDYYTVLHGTL